jgi:hypothetical protein
MKLLYAYTQELKDSSTLDDCQDINIFKQLYHLDADAWIVDRTRTLNFPFNEYLIDKNCIDEAYRQNSKEASVSFFDAAVDRANELLDTDQPLYVLWSGGIDSTAILVSFLYTNRPLTNVTVILNYSSVTEYKLFYEKFIKLIFKILVTEEAMLLMSLGSLNGIVVSGEQADQLVGSPLSTFIMQRMPEGSLAAECNFDNFNILGKAKGMNDQSIRCWYDLYSSTFDKAPRPIKTMFDLAWWHGFNFKWQKGSVVMYLRIDKSINVQTFYSGLPFQHWSIHYQPDLTNIKSEIKDFVYNFTNDTVYYKTKIKHPSSTLYYAVPASAALTSNFDKIQQKHFSLTKYHNPDNSIVKWLSNL